MSDVGKSPLSIRKEEDVGIWKATSSLMASIFWDLLAKRSDGINEVGIAVYQEPISNQCYEHGRKNESPLHAEVDGPYSAWCVASDSCMHIVLTDEE